MNEERIIALLFQPPQQLDPAIPLVQYKAYQVPGEGPCDLNFCYRQLISNGNTYSGYPEEITYMESRAEFTLIVLRLILISFSDFDIQLYLPSQGKRKPYINELVFGQGGSNFGISIKGTEITFTYPSLNEGTTARKSRTTNHENKSVINFLSLLNQETVSRNDVKELDSYDDCLLRIICSILKMWKLKPSSKTSKKVVEEKMLQFLNRMCLAGWNKSAGDTGQTLCIKSTSINFNNKEKLTKEEIKILLQSINNEGVDLQIQSRFPPIAYFPTIESKDAGTVAGAALNNVPVLTDVNVPQSPHVTSMLIPVKSQLLVFFTNILIDLITKKIGNPQVISKDDITPFLPELLGSLLTEGFPNVGELITKFILILPAKTNGYTSFMDKLNEGSGTSSDLKLFKKIIDSKSNQHISETYKKTLACFCIFYQLCYDSKFSEWLNNLYDKYFEQYPNMLINQQIKSLTKSPLLISISISAATNAQFQLELDKNTGAAVDSDTYLHDVLNQEGYRPNAIWVNLWSYKSGNEIKKLDECIQLMFPEIFIEKNMDKPEDVDILLREWETKVYSSYKKLKSAETHALLKYLIETLPKKSRIYFYILLWENTLVTQERLINRYKGNVSLLFRSELAGNNFFVLKKVIATENISRLAETISLYNSIDVPEILDSLLEMAPQSSPRKSKQKDSQEDSQVSSQEDSQEETQTLTTGDENRSSFLIISPLLGQVATVDNAIQNTILYFRPILYGAQFVMMAISLLDKASSSVNTAVKYVNDLICGLEFDNVGQLNFVLNITSSEFKAIQDKKASVITKLAAASFLLKYDAVIKLLSSSGFSILIVLLKNISNIKGSTKEYWMIRLINFAKDNIEGSAKESQLTDLLTSFRSNYNSFGEAVSQNPYYTNFMDALEKLKKYVEDQEEGNVFFDFKKRQVFSINLYNSASETGSPTKLEEGVLRMKYIIDQLLDFVNSIANNSAIPELDKKKLIFMICNYSFYSLSSISNIESSVAESWFRAINNYIIRLSLTPALPDSTIISQVPTTPSNSGTKKEIQELEKNINSEIVLKVPDSPELQKEKQKLEDNELKSEVESKSLINYPDLFEEESNPQELFVEPEENFLDDEKKYLELEEKTYPEPLINYDGPLSGIPLSGEEDTESTEVVTMDGSETQKNTEEDSLDSDDKEIIESYGKEELKDVKPTSDVNSGSIVVKEAMNLSEGGSAKSSRKKFNSVMKGGMSQEDMIKLIFLPINLTSYNNELQLDIIKPEDEELIHNLTILVEVINRNKSKNEATERLIFTQKASPQRFTPLPSFTPSFTPLLDDEKIEELIDVLVTRIPQSTLGDLRDSLAKSLRSNEPVQQRIKLIQDFANKNGLIINQDGSIDETTKATRVESNKLSPSTILPTTFEMPLFESKISTSFEKPLQKSTVPITSPFSMTPNKINILFPPKTTQQRNQTRNKYNLYPETNKKKMREKQSSLKKEREIKPSLKNVVSNISGNQTPRSKAMGIVTPTSIVLAKKRDFTDNYPISNNRTTKKREFEDDIVYNLENKNPNSNHKKARLFLGGKPKSKKLKKFNKSKKLKKYKNNKSKKIKKHNKSKKSNKKNKTKKSHN